MGKKAQNSTYKEEGKQDAEKVAGFSFVWINSRDYDVESDLTLHEL